MNNEDFNLESYDEHIDNMLCEKAEDDLQELLKKYNITDLGIEKENRFLGQRDDLRNFLIEANKKQLI